MNTIISQNDQTDDPSVEQFITGYLENLIDGTTAVFAGAGLSKPLGFVDWQDLLSPIAKSIGLDSAKEHDLVALAQYHVNEKLGNRHALTQILVKNFSKTALQTKNHEILCQLPIDTYWTTNYDKIIEQSLEKFDHIVDLKRELADMTINMPNKTVTVYKMHGDIGNVAKTILAKDEYLGYSRDNPAFVTALQYDLSRKSFLFIGFSFSDPNLESILNTVRLVYGPNSRPHYAFFKYVSLKEYYDEEKIKKMHDDEKEKLRKSAEEKVLNQGSNQSVSLKDYYDEEEINKMYDDKKRNMRKSAEDEVSYQRRKQELALKDLVRFNINAVMVKEYGDITGILERLYQRYEKRIVQGSSRKRTNTVYISGCADTYGDFNDTDGFLTRLTIALLDGDCMIISDRTPGVGTNILAIATQYICHKGYKSVSDYIISTPPSGVISKNDLGNMRKSLIEKARITIFLFGNSHNNPDEVTRLMNEEFSFAEACKSVIIPIGATGFCADILWKRVITQLEKYYPENGVKILPYIGLLGDNKIPADEIINAVVKIIDIHNSYDHRQDNNIAR